jgi:hypothetical protein
MFMYHKETNNMTHDPSRDAENIPDMNPGTAPTWEDQTPSVDDPSKQAENIPDMDPGTAPVPTPDWSVYKPEPLYPDGTPDSGQTDQSREGGG